MIRSWPLVSRIPRRLFHQEWNAQKYVNWHQFAPWEHNYVTPPDLHENDWNKLTQWALHQTKRQIKKSENWHMVYNEIMRCDPHIDSMAKTVYIIPLHVSPTVALFEDYQIIPLQTGRVYSFNDYNLHGINNEYNTKVQLLAVWRDEHFYNY